MGGPPHGRRAGRLAGRAAGVGLAALLVLALGGWAAWSAFVAARRSVTPQVLGWTAGTAAVVVRIAVDHPPGVATTCTLRALGRDAATVGSLDVAVPGTGRRSELTATVATTAKAFSVEVADCVRR